MLRGLEGVTLWVRTLVSLTEEADAIPSTCMAAHSCVTPIPRDLILLPFSCTVYFRHAWPVPTV